MKLKFLLPACLFYYLFVAFWSGFFAAPEYYLLQFAPDSAEYAAVANWFFHGQPTELIARRTFFYPFILGLARLIGGPMAIWCLQAALWLASAALLSQNLDLVVKRPWLRGLLFALFCSAWTPILLSLIALTESLVLFLLTLLSYLVLRWPSGDRWRSSWAVALILSSLLAATKPNYGPMFYTVIACVLVARFTGRLKASSRRVAAILAVSFLPLLTQLALHHQATGHWGTSNISQNVMQLNLYSQTLARMQGRDIQALQAEVVGENPRIGTMVAFLISHPLVTLTCIMHNYEENIRGVFHLSDEPRPVEEIWRKKVNSVFYWAHILFLLPMLWMLWRSRLWSTDREVAQFILGVVFLMSMLPLGMSFWAADRWTAPLLTLWPIVYVLAAQAMAKAREERV